uniref:Holliday junction resolvase n=2 Tax=viral metagenome TaxID=1070528 RepID=A0A6M3JF62_9ZZZZ
MMALKNAKAKGSRLENLAKRQLEAIGWAVTRAAASLGAWDLVAVKTGECADPRGVTVLLVQVKSNRWRPYETDALKDDIKRFNRQHVRGEIWRYDDGKPQDPRIKAVDDD